MAEKAGGFGGMTGAGKNGSVWESTHQRFPRARIARPNGAADTAFLNVGPPHLGHLGLRAHVDETKPRKRGAYRRSDKLGPKLALPGSTMNESSDLGECHVHGRSPD